MNEAPESRYAFGVVGRVFVAALALLPLWLALGAGAEGCGSLNTSSGLNGPCTRDYDCTTPLSCQSGVCTGPMEDAAPPREAGPKDSASDG